MNMPKIPENFFSVVENNIFSEDEKIDQTINSAMDSVWVIDNELSKEYFSKNSYNLLKANKDHLELVINAENIKNSNRDLTALTAAIERAKQAILLLDNSNTQQVDDFIQTILNEQQP